MLWAGKQLRLLLVLAIFSFTGFGLFQSAHAGKTIRLPHYDVKFGNWPLMEISKRAPRIKHGRGPRGRPIGRHPIKGYRLGPPPPPGKLVLISPNENKGVLHQHLQQTLKHYASKPNPLNQNLPIIVKGNGPNNPPPPPPGYKLGSPGGPLQNDGSYKLGPPPFPENTHSPNTVSIGGRPSRLTSMLKHAAHSGIFKDGVQTYTSPDFNPGPPLSGTFVTINPDGTQVTTHVNGDLVPPTGRISGGAQIKPSVPPVIRIGEIPENYTVVFAQRQIIGIKAPDTLELSGNENPETDEYELGLNLGTKYEQGYGAKPPPSHPLVVTKFQKRGNVEPAVVKKLIKQDLPNVGLIMTTSTVFNSPNISAPLDGKESPYFKEALQEKRQMEKQRKKEKPLDAQVKLLGRLFTKLQRLKPPKLAVPEDELDDYTSGGSTNGGWGYTEDDDGGWKKAAKSKVDSPIMAVQIQTYSAPEANSSDPDILESYAEFGTHDVEFGETDEIIRLMETAMKHGSARINLRDLGSNPQEINDNMLNWVRGHLTKSREINMQAHVNGEKLANNQFKQFQTFVRAPFDGNNGWGSGQPREVDPKNYITSKVSTNTHGVAGYQPDFS